MLADSKGRVPALGLKVTVLRLRHRRFLELGADAELAEAPHHKPVVCPYAYSIGIGLTEDISRKRPLVRRHRWRLDQE